jgi:hypothetical protein
MVSLHDCDGNPLFRVSREIGCIDLETMLNMHRQRFNAGMNEGRKAAFAQLRSILGVDDAITEAKRSAA